MAEIEKIGIERYIPGVDGEAPICREERQFALYLHNILLGIKAKKFEDKEKEVILKACGLDENAQIEHVFYEATFMRDIRCDIVTADEKNGSKFFNSILLEYIQGKKHLVFEMELDRVLELKAVFAVFGKNTWRPLAEVNIGTIGKKRLNTLKDTDGNIINANEDIKNVKKGLDTARAMMNSKPDLAVIYSYESGADSFLKFIECKYISPESGKEIKQTEVQKLIADFLCNCNGKMKILDNVSIDQGNEQGKSAAKLVRFISELSKDKDKGKAGEGNIEIKTLIDLNKKLFE